MLARRLRSFITATIALLVFIFNSVAVHSTTTVDTGRQAGDDVIRLGVDIVSLNITVVDYTGKFIRGLDENSFDVYEDKVRQQISYFSREETPISLGIVFDLSGSMKDKLGSAHEALKQFLQVSRDDDDICAVGFNETPRLYQDFTSSDSQVLNSLALMEAKGTTAVIDGVFLTLEKLRQGRHPRKAILLISDGQDNSSRYTVNELKEAMREADVQMYCIGVAQINGLQSDLDYQGFQTLADLADITGGKAFYPKTPTELEAVCNYIAFELRSQYSLGYQSTNQARDGKWRDVRVRVHTPKKIGTAAVRCRTGYFALGPRTQ